MVRVLGIRVITLKCASSGELSFSPVPEKKSAPSAGSPTIVLGRLPHAAWNPVAQKWEKEGGGRKFGKGKKEGWQVNFLLAGVYCFSHCFHPFLAHGDFSPLDFYD